MDMRQRAKFIREKMDGCDVVIFIRAADWGIIIGELTNVITFFGSVNGHWEPVCAKIVPDDFDFKVIGAYYDAI